MATSAAIAGCQATPSSPAPASKTRPAEPAQIHEIGDPCANRLHDLEAYLVLYVAMRHQLPPTLEALRPMATGKPLLLDCPASGRPYVYRPQGLAAEGDSRVLIVYDALAAHDGNRQAIMLTPAKGNRAPFFEVILVTDEILRAFHAPDVR